MDRGYSSAVKVLHKCWVKGRPLSSAMRDVLSRGELDDGERARAAEISHGTVRWLRWLDLCLEPAPGSDTAPLVKASAFRILKMGESAEDVMPDAEELGKRFGLDVGAIRETLQGVDPEKAAAGLPDDPIKKGAIEMSLPDWLFGELHHAWGDEHAGEVAAYLNSAPPTALRVNARRTSIQDAMDIARGEGIELRPGVPDGCLFGDARLPRGSRLLEEGRVMVQDPGSQYVALAAAPDAGKKMLDYCAGSGGKSFTAAFESPEAEIWAWDADGKKLDSMERRAARLGVGVKRWDGKEPASFDVVLVDAPCSGLGAMRRNPEAKWKVRLDDVPRFAEYQSVILREASAAVDAGGLLLYSVCTFTRKETVEVVRKFLEANDDFSLEPFKHVPEGATTLLDGAGILTYPYPDESDIFFVARLRRR